MLEHFKTGPLDNNVYVLIDPATACCAVIDPGVASEHILESLTARGLTVSVVVNTHGHWDHVAGNALFLRAAGAVAPLYRHPLDEESARHADRAAARWGFSAEPSPPATQTLDEGDRFDFGPYHFVVRHIPGHSPGSICLIDDEVVIAGDVLFRGAVGRTDFAGGSLPQLLDGIRSKLLPLPDHLRVLPGHGDPTTIGEERRTNRFLMD